MMKYITNILILLLASTAVLSCSMAYDMMDQEGEVGYALEISGKVSDAGTGSPIEEIRITVNAMRNGKEVAEQHTYTDNQGNFMILLNEAGRPSTVVLTADDINGRYVSVRQELMIPWDSSHNIKDGIFYINNCNFHLSKPE